MATKPSLADVGAPVQADLLSIERLLVLCGSTGSATPVSVLGIKSVQFAKRPGDAFLERHLGSKFRLQGEIGPGVDGFFEVSAGRFITEWNKLRGVSGFGSTHFAADLRTDSSLSGWIVLNGKSPDGLITTFRAVLPDIVVLDVEDILSGAPGDTANVRIPFKSDSRFMPVDPTTFPIRFIFTMDGVQTTVVCDEVLKKATGDKDVGKTIADYLFFAYERPSGSALNYGGTPIDNIVTVTPGTPVGSTTITIPGAARASGTKVDLAGLVLETDL